MSEILLHRSEHGVATVTLNRPHRKNAVPPNLWAELQRTFEAVSQCASDRVLVVTGVIVVVVAVLVIVVRAMMMMMKRMVVTMIMVIQTRKIGYFCCCYLNSN